jgi:hypothetical protein
MPDFTIDYIELARMTEEASILELPSINELLDSLEAQRVELTLADAVRMLAISTEAIALANKMARPASEVF